MAKLEKNFQGDFDAVLERIHNGILNSSVSATYEDGSDVFHGQFRCAVRVYERYSVIGSNRVALSLTLMGVGRDLHLTAITAGGSQAVVFKVNTFGEEAFLDTLREIVRDL